MKKPTKQGWLSEHIYYVYSHLSQDHIVPGYYSVGELPDLKYDTQFFRGDKFVFFDGKGWVKHSDSRVYFRSDNDWFSDNWANEYLIGISKYYED